MDADALMVAIPVVAALILVVGCYLSERATQEPSR